MKAKVQAMMQKTDALESLAELDAAPNALAPDPEVLAPVPAVEEELPVPAVTSSPTAPEIDAMVPALGA